MKLLHFVRLIPVYAVYSNFNTLYDKTLNVKGEKNYMF